MPKKHKLSKSEKIDRDIRLAYRKQERAIEMQRKAERMLKSSAISLAKLHKAKRRQDAKAANELVETAAPKAPPPKAEPAMDDPNHPDLVAARELLSGINADNGIPDFLDRNKQLQTLPDPKTKEKKAERKAVEKEVRHAELTGKRRKMPLSGKAALDAISKQK